MWARCCVGGPFRLTRRPYWFGAAYTEPGGLTLRVRFYKESEAELVSFLRREIDDLVIGDTNVLDRNRRAGGAITLEGQALDVPWNTPARREMVWLLQFFTTPDGFD